MKVATVLLSLLVVAFAVPVASAQDAEPRALLEERAWTAIYPIMFRNSPGADVSAYPVVLRIYYAAWGGLVHRLEFVQLPTGTARMTLVKANSSPAQAPIVVAVDAALWRTLLARLADERTRLEGAYATAEREKDAMDRANRILQDVDPKLASDLQLNVEIAGCVKHSGVTFQMWRNGQEEPPSLAGGDCESVNERLGLMAEAFAAHLIPGCNQLIDPGVVEEPSLILARCANLSGDPNIAAQVYNLLLEPDMMSGRRYGPSVSSPLTPLEVSVARMSDGAFLRIGRGTRVRGGDALDAIKAAAHGDVPNFFVEDVRGISASRVELRGAIQMIDGTNWTAYFRQQWRKVKGEWRIMQWDLQPFATPTPTAEEAAYFEAQERVGRELYPEL